MLQPAQVGWKNCISEAGLVSLKLGVGAFLLGHGYEETYLHRSIGQGGYKHNLTRNHLVYS